MNDGPVDPEAAKQLATLRWRLECLAKRLPDMSADSLEWFVAVGKVADMLLCELLNRNPQLPE